MNIDAKAFDQIAREIFAPVYPLIARQIIDETRITRGICLDMGSGGGYLGMAVADLTDLFVRFLDSSPEMLDILRKNITQQGLEDHTDVLEGDVGAIPLTDGSVDLAVSRGSAFFWKDLAGAFREIYRVLTPGGAAVIGGGFGSAALKADIGRKMDALDQGSGRWRKKVARNLGPETAREFEKALKAAGIPAFEVRRSEETGVWAIFRKER